MRTLIETQYRIKATRFRLSSCLAVFLGDKAADLWIYNLEYTRYNANINSTSLYSNAIYVKEDNGYC
jgi:hypothetical protein